jgi:hypothetical protein
MTPNLSKRGEFEWSSFDESNSHHDSQLSHTSSADSTVIVLLAASDETSNVCEATTAYIGIPASKSPLESEQISSYTINEKSDILSVDTQSLRGLAFINSYDLECETKSLLMCSNSVADSDAIVSMQSQRRRELELPNERIQPTVPDSSFDTQSLCGLAFINSYDLDCETNSLLMINHSGADSDDIVSKQWQRRQEIELPNEIIKPTVPIHLKNYQSNHRTVENSLQTRNDDRIPKEVRFQRDSIHQRVPIPRANTSRFRVKVPTEIKVYQRG